MVEGRRGSALLAGSRLATATGTCFSTPRGTETVIGDVQVHGDLKSITASTTDLTGEVDVAGSLRSLVLDDVSGGTIRIHSDAGLPLGKNTATSLKFDRVSDTNVLSNGVRVTSLHASEWVNSDLQPDQIQAPAIGELKITGNRKQSIAGDFGADLVIAEQVKTIRVTGDATGNVEARAIGSWSVGGDLKNAEVNLSQPVDPERGSVLSLGTLKVGGVLENSAVNTAGRIGSVTLGGMHNSRIFAGIGGEGSSLPDDRTDFVAAASIRSLELVGATAEYVNSQIAAATIGRLSLRGIDVENADIPFGIAADRIAALTLKHGGKTTRERNLADTDQSTELDDFLVRIV